MSDQPLATLTAASQSTGDTADSTRLPARTYGIPIAVALSIAVLAIAIAALRHDSYAWPDAPTIFQGVGPFAPIPADLIMATPGKYLTAIYKEHGRQITLTYHDADGAPFDQRDYDTAVLTSRLFDNLGTTWHDFGTTVHANLNRSVVLFCNQYMVVTEPRPEPGVYSRVTITNRTVPADN